MNKQQPFQPLGTGGPMLTVYDVAELTAMSVAFWRREIRLKQIRVTRFGRALRISEADVRSYMARRSAGKC